MNRDVEGAIGALLAAEADTVEEAYEDQELVPAYDGEEYDDLDALAADLAGESPDHLATVSYDDIAAAVTGDAVYHEVLHGQTFTSDRPAAEAVDRMRLEADDRTSTGRGLDGAESGLRFHVEEDPFITLWDDDGTTRYAAVQLVPEARKASCRRTRISYPGKVFAVTGTLDAAPETVLPDAEETMPVPDDPVPGDDTESCPVPDAARMEEPPEEDPTRRDILAYTHSQFTETGTFDQDTYTGMMKEAADNLYHFEELAKEVLLYSDRYADAADGKETDLGWLRDRIETELDALLDADEVGFEDGSSDLKANFFGALKYTAAVVANGVAPTGDGTEEIDAWEVSFREADGDRYKTVAYEHQTGAVLNTLPHNLIAPLLDGEEPDWDALDTRIDEHLDEGEDLPGSTADFDGNETTAGMFQ